MRTWLLAAAAALAFGGGGLAQEAAVAPDPAPPAIPPPPPPSPTVAASQAEALCIPSVVPAGGRCRVAGFSPVGEVGGARVQWALYDIHSSGGRQGLALLLTPDADPSRLRAAASLAVSGGGVDRWERSPYTAAGVIKSGEADYAGMAVRGEAGIAAFSLSRVEAGAWTPIEAGRLPVEIEAKILALTRAGCRISTGGVDWRFFRVRHGLMSDEGSCGTAMIDLTVADGAVKIGDALVIR